MDYPISLTKYPDLNLCLRPGGLFTGAQILKDNAPLKKSRSKVLVPLADGSTIELKIKSGLDMTPKVEFQGIEMEVMPALPVPWMIWAYIPLLLIFVGGAIGGLCGGVAAAGTMMALRSELPKPLRIVIALLAPPLGIVAYGVLAFIFIKASQ